MSIERKSKTQQTADNANQQSTQSGAQAQQGQQQQYQGASQGSGQAGGFGGLNLNSLFRRPVGRSLAGEAVSNYAEELRKLLERETREGAETPIRLLVLDSSEALVALSSILVCLPHRAGGKDYVAVYTLLVEGSVDGELNDRQININGQPVEVTTVAGDIYDEAYWQQVQKRVIDSFGGGANIIVEDAGKFVIPRELEYQDTKRLHNVLFNATTALVTVMDNILGGVEGKFHVGQVSNRVNLNARLDYTTKNTESAAGLPVRSDVNITLQGSLVAGGQSQYEQMMNLTRVGGFVDLVYDASAPQQPQQQAWGWNPQQPPQTQRYFPRFVITENDSEVNAITMELQLLGLSTATLLANNRAWVGAFHQNYAAEGIDLRDIGAIGYEVNLTGDPNAEPERIPVKADSFSRDSLYQLLSMAIHDGLIYSMDVEESGELYWIHGAFAAAAQGDQDARALIIDAANNLTNQHFGQFFGNEAIAIDDNNRIHLGYYNGPDGQRDLRDLDYLGMLNMIGDKDMPTVIKFAETFDRVDIPLEIRLEQRLRILRAVLGDNNVTVKGFARRITFNPNFIVALEQSASAAGLVVRPSNITQDFSGMGMRGNTSASQYAVRNFSGRMFQSGQPNWGGYSSQNSIFGRWGR